MAKCGACGKFSLTADCARCSKCSDNFHKGCVAIPSMGVVLRGWICPSWSARVPRGDNAAALVRGLTVVGVHQTSNECDVDADTMNQSVAGIGCKLIRKTGKWGCCVTGNFASLAVQAMPRPISAVTTYSRPYKSFGHKSDCSSTTWMAKTMQWVENLFPKIRCDAGSWRLHWYVTVQFRVWSSWSYLQ